MANLARASVPSVAVLFVFSVCSVAGLLAQQLPRYVERVDVTRVLIDARALDERGRPILGLAPEDFRVKIAGKPARVESVLWVEGGAVDPDGLPLDSTPLTGLVSPAPGRLVVFLFQKDLEPSRILGFMRLLIETREFLERFQPSDRVAVVSFDYHLKVWIDFTNDFTRIERILERGILLEKPPQVEPSPGVSLVARLDASKGRRIYTMEKALLAIADALEPLPGAKSLVLVGHGWGRFTGSSLFFDRQYGPAVEAFQAGRVTVFTLDTTEADSHTLDAGLISVAEHTGGFFRRTHLFSRAAMRDLGGALAGHYVLFVERPFGDKGYHRIEVDLVGRRGTVMAKSGFVG